jgi:ADP-ribosyl-[dinitrogen reductase] hydrolase
MENKIDQYRGCLLGLAIGDALGAPIEFKTRGTFEPITDMISGGTWSLKAGQWTDDTSLALCLASSLIECDEFNPIDQMERFLKWHREGYMSSTGNAFDIGHATLTSLEKFAATKNPYSGSIDPYTAGNGSIMRLAPVPLYYANNIMEVFEYSGESSKTTHGAIEAVDGCRYLGLLIAGVIGEIPKEELLSKDYLKDISLAPKIRKIADGSFKDKSSLEIRGTGYVVDCLEAALWAFYNHDNFKDGCLAAVNLGDDADTTGAVYGQLAGAYYGIKNIPEKWLNTIYAKEDIIYMAECLYELAEDRK